jgi:hypothetical protein
VRRTVTISEPRGFLKVLIGAESDEILGFTAFGVEADEMMAVVQTAMLGKPLAPRCATRSWRTRQWPRADSLIHHGADTIVCTQHPVRLSTTRGGSCGMRLLMRGALRAT